MVVEWREMEDHVALRDVDVVGLQRLLDVVQELQRVQTDVACGPASDHIENAFDQVRKAMRLLGS